MGMVCLSLGMEMLVQNSGSNPFGDSFTLWIVIFSLLFCMLFKYILLTLAGLLKIYAIPIKGKKKIEKAEGVVPNWKRVADMKAMFGGHEAMLNTVDTARITEEAFRHRFIDLEENRTWIGENLPAMLTPRFIVSLASTLASNISQALVRAGRWRGNNPNIENDDSILSISDDDSDDEFGTRFINTGPLEQIVLVSRQSLNQNDADANKQALIDLQILRLWLFWVKRKQSLIDFGLQLCKRLMQDECEICADHLSELKAIPIVPLERLIDEFEKHLVVNGAGDLRKWESFVLSNERVRTICIPCLDDDDRRKGRDLVFGGKIVHEMKLKHDLFDNRLKAHPLNAADKKIASLWLALAKKSVNLMLNSMKLNRAGKSVGIISPKNSTRMRVDPLHLVATFTEEDDEELMLKSFRPANLESTRRARPPQVRPLPLSSVNLALFSSISPVAIKPQQNNYLPNFISHNLIDDSLVTILKGASQQSARKSALNMPSHVSALKYEISDDSDENEHDILN